jgi:enhancing lycopene biosynthesis protein 2
MPQRKAAFILSGCGYLDGNDLTETVSFIIACSQAHLQPIFFTAHGKEIEDVFIHSTKVLDPGEERIMHKEVARITRGLPRDLNKLDVEEYDILVIPGGNGNTRNFTNFEQENWKGDIEIDANVKSSINSFYRAKKPIVVSSNATVLLAKALEGESLQLVMGRATERYVIDVIERLVRGTKVIESGEVTTVQVDDKNKIVSTPGYGANVNATPSDIYAGIRETINAVLGLLSKKE